MSSGEPPQARPSVWRQLRALRALERERQGPHRWAVWAAIPVLVGLGALASPSDITPTVNGGVTHWGGWPLETAFALTLVATMWITFRTLEVIFRTHDAEALAALPLRSAAIALDRWLVAWRDATRLGLLIAAFVAGAAIKAPVIGLVAATFPLVGATVATGIAFGIVAAAGVATTVPESGLARGVDRQLGEVAGGVYHVAPGIAFAVNAALLLFAKLGLEEPLRVWAEHDGLAMTRAGWVALGGAVAVGASAAVYGVKALAAHYHAIAAKFRDAETYVLDEDYAFFRSTEPQTGSHARLDALLRKDRVTLNRVSALRRAGTYVVAGLGLFVAWATRDQVAPGAVSALLSAWLIVLVAPFATLERLSDDMAALLCADGERRYARWRAALEDTARHGLWLSVPAIALGSPAAAIQHVAIIATTAAVMAAAAAWSRPALGLAGWVALVALALGVDQPVVSCGIAALSLGVVGWRHGALRSLVSTRSA